MIFEINIFKYSLEDSSPPWGDHGAKSLGWLGLKGHFLT
jgi:hypothetical protein